MTEHSLRRVPPFGYPRIIACLRLPVAFRSLPRPSSAISALASTLRSSSLDLLRLRVALLRPLRRPFGLLVSACSLFLCSFQGADERPPGKSFPPANLQSDTVKESGKTRFFGAFCRGLPPAGSPSGSPLRSLRFAPLFASLLRARFDLGFRSALRLASLPRKEVIQPHLPIRLPCYDFTPVIGLTFDG